MLLFRQTLLPLWSRNSGNFLVKVFRFYPAQEI